MQSSGYLWAFLASLTFAVTGQSDDHRQDEDSVNPECSCSGLDYTNGGSYLVDGNSDDDFTFTSVFEGCFEATITPVLVSPDAIGYECSPVESQQDGVEQASACPIAYSEMISGMWIIVLDVPEHEFTVQRQFNLTIGSDDVNTVIVTVTPTVYEGVTSTVPGETVTSWIVETETEYQDPETTTGDCYSQTDTVIQYIPGPTTKIVSEIGRLSTAGIVTQYYATTVTENAYCHWPVTPTRDQTHPTRTVKPTRTLTKGTSTTSRRRTTTTRPTVTTRVVTLSSRTSSRPATPTSPRITTITRKPTTTSRKTSSTTRRTSTTRGTVISTATRPRTSSVPRPTTTSRRITTAVTTITRPGTTPTTRPTTTPTTRPTTTPTTRRTTTPTRKPTVTPTVTSIVTSRRSATSRPVTSTVTTRRTTSNSPRASTTTRRSTTAGPPKTTTRRITSESQRPTVTTRVTTLNPPRTTSTRRVTTANPPRSTTVRLPTTSRQQQPTTSRRQQPTTTLRTGRTGLPTSTPRGGGGGSQQPTSRRPTSSRGGGGSQPPRTTRRPGEALTPEAIAIPITAVARIPLAKAIDVTSTVYDSTTVTQTIIELEEEETSTELEFYTTTTTFTPPAQTVCDAETTVTLFWQGPPRTDYEIIYKTYYTWATVWIGQTQYTTSTDYPAMTRCSKGGGWYGS